MQEKQTQKESSRLGEVIRFAVSGGVCALIEMGVLWLLVDKVHMDTIPGTAIAFLVSVAVNYLMCMAWVFKGAKDGGLSAKLGFAVTSGIGFFLNLLLMWIFKNALGEDRLLLTVFRFEVRMYLLNKAIATLLVMVWNYFTKKAILQSSAMRKLADRLKPAKREAQNSPDPEETASDDRSMNDGTDSAKGE